MVIFENGNIRISVRNLVEFLLRKGDIDNRFAGKKDKKAMLEGSKLHRKLQARMGGEYQAEVSIRHTMEYGDFNITIEGRADGIITPVVKNEDDPDIIVDEIKTMYADVTKKEMPEFVHKAQAMCYGYIYGIKYDLQCIGIRITYANLDTEEIKKFDYTYNINELEEWFLDLMDEYYMWARMVYEHRKKRNETAKMLEFPFEYREGQRDIAVSTYKAIRAGKELYIQAPTGVGKTMSVIFPSVKAMGEELTDKIFYLTAKTITGTVAVAAYDCLRKKGLNIKSIVVTAKEKICVMDETNCNPIHCERAKGHFDRVNKAIYDMVTNEMELSRETILEYANKYNVCPFELSLDASYFADGIICDYNYAFDPNAKLKRYFAEGKKSDYVFLIDEAHNLVDRAREMFSAAICKEKLLLIKRILNGRDKRTSTYLEKCNKNLLQKKRECGTGKTNYLVEENISDFVIQLERLYACLEKVLEISGDFEGREEVLLLYFEINSFLSIYDVMDENYRVVYEFSDSGEFYVRLMCINPSANLKNCMDMVTSTIMFSATLLPVNYYKYLLSGNMEAYAIYIGSPFEKEKRFIALGSDVGTKYTRRGDDEYKKIADYIQKVTSKKKGNYMVFFPSYRFMEAVKEKFLLQISGEKTKADILTQTAYMTEKEREEFLLAFETERKDSMIAFCIMGGIFSEGIDLTEEKLIGSIVVGTGFPQVGMEREIIKDFFDDKGMNGFDFAYRYPGMNKVLQAAGRVIRTTEDVGVILLLDDRFLNYEYKKLFPREWDDRQIVKLQTISEKIEKFWNEH